MFEVMLWGQIVRIVIKVPTNISKEEKKLYEQLRSLEGVKKDKPNERFIDKIKKLLNYKLEKSKFIVICFFYILKYKKYWYNKKMKTGD